ncbi:baseplate J/gp47 family protein [Pseudoalteromonas sp. MMG005]|uniref:baseplate assembly protein n=1 Tax=Pseudoalteromonas sp. MMG005 TaxID=2822682 RepID=UPI001B39DB84|nr:baseplate J/gp47 family protein [Pseudoalteromonas sp. MMG005]MBQ4844935.1 baseplate J/gp47 family protein [Pseudoalteromonas sp. MMG005]
MPTSQLLDLSKLPAPAVLEQLDAEQLLSTLKNMLITNNPELASTLALESDPLTQLLNAYAYQSSLLRARVNDAAKSTLLASAMGSDLDHIATRYSVTRLAGESDERLRQRILKAFHSLNTAGTQESYEYHTLSADARVKDVFVTSPSPSHIVITILSNETPKGLPSNDLMNKLETTFGLKAGDQNSVSDVLSAQKIRPIGDRVQLLSAKTRTFNLQAKIKLELGPGHAQVEQQVRNKVAGYLSERAGLGKHIKRSALFAVLHQAGVEEVELLSPIDNILVQNDEVALCDNALTGLEFEVLI